jgi:hypothetical protein
MVMWDLKKFLEALRPTLKRSLKIWVLEESETYSNNFSDPGVASQEVPQIPSDSASTLALVDRKAEIFSMTSICR